MSLVNLKPVFYNFMIGGGDQPIPLFELELNWNSNSKDIIPSITPNNPVATNEDRYIVPNVNPVAPVDPNVLPNEEPVAPNEDPNIASNEEPVAFNDPKSVSEDRLQKMNLS